jgi:hypothetical protein
MRCFAPRTRAPVRAKTASRPDRRAREERPARLPAGLSLADVPVHARPAGLPQPLKAGVERLSGLAMDDVRVHRDSPEPARLGALAFTQGRDIHLGRGQERHLPHEAWHAVQQMQGRVKATARLGGVALNEDPALEADADRMGASAEGPGLPPAQLRREPVQAAAVQRKVLDQDRPLEASRPMSTVLGQYVASDVTYVLGEDSRADLTRLPVHLIDSRLKYLLGENHSSGKWEKDTGQWPFVPKMEEQQKGIPHEADDTAGGLDIVTNPLALESRHAYLLSILLDAHEYTNLLNAQFADKRDWQSVALIEQYADGLLGELGEIEASVVAYERWSMRYAVVNQGGFAAKYDPKRHGASARLTQIRTFAENLSLAWSFSLEEMMSETRALNESMVELKKKVANLQGVDLETTRLQVVEIAKGKAAISGLSTTLTDIVGFSPRSGGAVRDFAISSGIDAPKPVDDALDLARERGMIANIRDAEAPLLIRIGNDHLADVAMEAGKNVQVVDMTEKLEKFTARNSFFEPVVENQQAARRRR